MSKLGSLFDGIGGFPLAASRYGIIPVWASEIEPFPIKVTEHHFPDMKHLGDITQINGGEIEPVDIITFGSPCQDLSVAGKREGLQGERSGLFMDAIRIIRQMRTATGGKYPRFAVWENVPGAFSSNKGEDFRAVLEEIAEAEIPMPRSGKWATAGMVRTERVDVAWRTLDAQYWGVPQRRKRIFLVADFGGQCAGEILFIEEGLRGHFAESGKAREEAAGNAGTSVKRSSDIIFDPYNNAVSDNCTSLGSNCGMSTGRSIVMRMREGGDTAMLVTPYQETVGSLCARDYKGVGNQYVSEDKCIITPKYSVRRLTPLECLRLQGYPDWWLDIEGASDTAKYKAIGNSVAIVCVDFIMAGIAEVLLCG